MKVEVVLLADEMRAKFWSKEPYRHAQIAVRLTNNKQATVDGVTFEVLVPEDALFDFSGDAWHPSHKHLIDGTACDVWVDREGAGLTGNGIIYPRGARVEQKLALNLKPHVDSLTIRWRLFHHEEPMGNLGVQELALTLLA